MISNYISQIEQFMIGEDSIPNQLRNCHHFDKKSYNELVDVMHKVISYYRDKEDVPKRLALCFIDVLNNFYVNQEYFSKEEFDEIEDAGLKISELANILFS